MVLVLRPGHGGGMRAELYVVALLALGGCAAIDRYDGEIPPPDARVIHAYHAVRSAGATAAHAGGLVFCATQNGLETIRSVQRGSDQWAATLDDAVVEDHVRGALKSDRALRHEVIDSKMVRGEVFLYGKLASDAHATLAIYDALQVMGVFSVYAAFVTPESPEPMQARALADCK